jgi:hypothetical protein
VLSIWRDFSFFQQVYKTKLKPNINISSDGNQIVLVLRLHVRVQDQERHARYLEFRSARQFIHWGLSGNIAGWISVRRVAPLVMSAADDLGSVVRRLSTSEADRYDSLEAHQHRLLRSKRRMSVAISSLHPCDSKQAEGHVDVQTCHSGPLMEREGAAAEIELIGRRNESDFGLGTNKRVPYGYSQRHSCDVWMGSPVTHEAGGAFMSADTCFPPDTVRDISAEGCASSQAQIPHCLSPDEQVSGAVDELAGPVKWTPVEEALCAVFSMCVTQVSGKAFATSIRCVRC